MNPPGVGEKATARISFVHSPLISLSRPPPGTSSHILLQYVPPFLTLLQGKCPRRWTKCVSHTLFRPPVEDPRTMSPKHTAYVFVKSTRTRSPTTYSEMDGERNRPITFLFRQRVSLCRSVFLMNPKHPQSPMKMRHGIGRRGGISGRPPPTRTQ